MSQSPRVLVVDDEPNMARAIATALERSGYRCETADGGEAALRAFEREPAEVVVTDRKMPGLDGIELMRRLKRLSPTLTFRLVNNTTTMTR